MDVAEEVSCRGRMLYVCVLFDRGVAAACTVIFPSNIECVNMISLVVDLVVLLILI